MRIMQGYGEQAGPLATEKLLCLKEELKKFYYLSVDSIKLLRKVGGAVFVLSGADGRYILKLYKEESTHIAQKAFSTARLLEERGVFAPGVMGAKTADLCALSTGETGYIYSYIDGVKAGGAHMFLLGGYVASVHKALGDLACGMEERGKEHYIDSLIGLLHECGVDAGMAGELEACGKQLWRRLSHLKKGVIHGDLNRTNILVDAAGRPFIIDLDSVCNGFLMYDAAVICEAFRHKPFSKEQMDTSAKNYVDFCAGYGIEPNMQAFFDLLTMRRFELNAIALQKIKYLKIPALKSLISKEANNLLEWQQHGAEFCKGL